jgi:tetratricopeptide (TPR) repeat protein
MTQDLIDRGNQYQAAGDTASAEAAFREADALDSAEGAILLGLILRQRSELAAAADAFRRAEARGHPEAGSCLGNLLSDTGDLDGARAAYERSIAAGSVDAVLNLGLMFAQQGAVDEALPHLRVAQESGDIVASWAIGKLLEGQGDLTGAAAAYRQAAVGGNADAAFGLGVVLTKLEDQEGARAAFQRAHELGHPKAAEVVELLDTTESAKDRAQDGMKFVSLYVAACEAVLSAANSCLEIANRAVGARQQAAERPQHEISIKHFTEFAENAEREFVPLYQTFAEASSFARDSAAQLLASQSDPFDAEMILAGTVDPDVLDNVGTAWAILTSNYGPTPGGFIQGVAETNQLMAGEREGNIYRPPAADAPSVVSAGERACPWCAETIKATAVICRFCNRDVQAGSTSS